MLKLCARGPSIDGISANRLHPYRRDLQGQYGCCKDNFVVGVDENIIATVIDSVHLEKLENYELMNYRIVVTRILAPSQEWRVRAEWRARAAYDSTAILLMNYSKMYQSCHSCAAPGRAGVWPKEWRPGAAYDCKARHVGSTQAMCIMMQTLVGCSLSS